jgi:ABC-type molybdate transport system substrate-binding protein
MILGRALALCALIALGIPAVAQESSVRLYAAGSLRAVMTEIGAAFTKDTSVAVSGEFGESGLLRDRLAKGEAADVFASANMEHPLSLAQSGRAGPVALFARNRLCALVAPGLALLDRGGPAAARFALFVMSVRGQEILARHGFSAPALP